MPQMVEPEAIVQRDGADSGEPEKEMNEFAPRESGHAPGLPAGLADGLGLRSVLGFRLRSLRKLRRDHTPLTIGSPAHRNGVRRFGHFSGYACGLAKSNDPRYLGLP